MSESMNINKQISDLDLRYIHNPSFETARDTGLHKEICKRIPLKKLEPFEDVKVIDSNTCFLRVEYYIEKEDMIKMFRKFNYCLYMATQLFKAENFRQGYRWYKRAEKLRGILVLANYRLIPRYLSRYAINSKHMEECSGVLLDGLFLAVRLFDYSQGFCFSTYCYKVFKSKMYALYKQREKELQSIPISPDDNESVTDMTHSYVHDVLKHESRMFASHEVKILLDKIPVRSKEIISQIFGIGHANSRTMQDVAKEWNMTRQNVHSIKKKAFEKIRQYANTHFSQAELESLSEM